MYNDKSTVRAHHNLLENQRSPCPQSPGPESGPLSGSCSSPSHCGPSPVRGCLRGSAERWSWGDGPPWSVWFALHPPGTSAGSPTHALMLPLRDRRGVSVHDLQYRYTAHEFTAYVAFWVIRCALTCFQCFVCSGGKHVKWVSFFAIFSHLVRKLRVHKTFLLLLFLCLYSLKRIITW